jgi:hypothetical protein
VQSPTQPLQPAAEQARKGRESPPHATVFSLLGNYNPPPVLEGLAALRVFTDNSIGCEDLVGYPMDEDRKRLEVIGLEILRHASVAAEHSRRYYNKSRCVFFHHTLLSGKAGVELHVIGA